MKRHGFTLLETLAVVVLLSLALTMIAGGMARGTASTSAAKAHEVIQLDRRARSLGAMGVACRLVSSGSGVTLVQEKGNTVLGFVACGEGTHISLRSGGVAVPFLRIGTDSRCADYSIVIENAGATGGQTVPFVTVVHGLTGAANVEGAP